MTPEQDPTGLDCYLPGLDCYPPNAFVLDWNFSSITTNVFNSIPPVFHNAPFPQPTFQPPGPFSPQNNENPSSVPWGIQPSGGPPGMTIQQSPYPFPSTIPIFSSTSHPRVGVVPATTVTRTRNPRKKRVSRGLALTGGIHPPITVPTVPLPIPSFPLVATFPENWVKIPQEIYNHGSKQLDFKQSKSIPFSTKDHPGINLRDALRKNYTSLDGRDDPMLQSTVSGVISCRLLFPGYPDNGTSCQIHTLNWTRVRTPIPRSKLAHEVARKVDQYLAHMARIDMDASVGNCWRVGQGFMHIDNMYLVSLVSVSKGSFQPEIWVAVPPTQRVRVNDGRN